MKKGERKAPVVAFNPFEGMSPKEKEFLRGVITHPTYVKMLNLAQRLKPSSNCSGAGSGARDAFSDARASARLAEMRGWDLYQAAIFAVLNDKPVKQLIVEASYPDSGRFGEEKPSPEQK